LDQINISNLYFLKKATLKMSGDKDTWKNILEKRLRSNNFMRNYSTFLNANQPKYSQNEEYLIKNLVYHLKISNGDWSKNGLQRVVRIKSECSQHYVTLRSHKIKANIPFKEAFFDHNSKIMCKKITLFVKIGTSSTFSPNFLNFILMSRSRLISFN
jgi:hypothetical protein